VKPANLFNFSDRLQMAALDHLDKRKNVIAANIANAETPGFRALGYDFQEQLASLAHLDSSLPLETSAPEHFKNSHTKANGEVRADVYVKPTESVGEDGNTVYMDGEMQLMAENQLLYRTSIELLNRKIGMLKYGINGGR
jgi:flagellar basal-body rod protein FlgB